MSEIYFHLAYSGRITDAHAIDFYDVSQALIGFQRSLALTVHAVINDEVITQAPSLRGAEIYAYPPAEGSWKTTAIVVAGVFGGIYQLGTAPRDTPLGNLISSAYDYVISECLGFHVDYSTTLGQQIDQMKRNGTLKKLPGQSRLDGVIEKSEKAVQDMHRPIVKSKTAELAKISVGFGAAEQPYDFTLDTNTYEYISYREMDDTSNTYLGRVSSYNINTYKGRIFVEGYQRAVPFELAEQSRGQRAIALITRSLARNAESRRADDAEIRFSALLVHSRSGQVKSFYILSVDAK
ncbi:MAG: hypothetical protein WC689_06320 [Methylocystis sp.]|jgi:hypothetical protein